MMCEPIETENNKTESDQNIQKQRMEWRKKTESIPDLKGGKNNWFQLIKELGVSRTTGKKKNL